MWRCHVSQVSKRHKALNNLADIRDYLRMIQSHLGRSNPEQFSTVVPKELVDQFNTVAKTLGADEGWMVYGVGS